MHMIIFDEKEKNFVFVESYESYGESLHGNIYSDWNWLLDVLRGEIECTCLFFSQGFLSQIQSCIHNDFDLEIWE